MRLVLFTSPYAEKKMQRKLTPCELLLLNYIASTKGTQPCESAVMSDLVRSRKVDYVTLVERFIAYKIITYRGNYYFDKANRSANYCRRIQLSRAVMADFKSEKNRVHREVKVKWDGQKFEDTSEIRDATTRAVLENISKLSIDQAAVDKAELGMENLVILKKFMAGVRGVKKSRTGRISHILLNAGSKLVRQFFVIAGERPADVDGASFHWQLLANKLEPADKAKLDSMIATGFYEGIMEGTGCTDRKQIKAKCQQVLTNKKTGRLANAIRDYLFKELPSLEKYCVAIWSKGKTVQSTLQQLESDFVNRCVDQLTERGIWCVPFYDGFWVQRKDLPVLLSLTSIYIFEEKI